MRKIIFFLFLPLSCLGQSKENVRLWGLFTDFRGDSNRLDNFKMGGIYSLQDGPKIGTFVSFVSDPDNVLLGTGPHFSRYVKMVDWHYEIALGSGVNFRRHHGISIHAVSYGSFETKHSKERVKGKLSFFVQAYASKHEGVWVQSYLGVSVRKWLGLGIHTQTEGVKGPCMYVMLPKFNYSLSYWKDRATIGLIITK